MTETNSNQRQRTQTPQRLRRASSAITLTSKSNNIAHRRYNTNNYQSLSNINEQRKTINNLTEDNKIKNKEIEILKQKLYRNNTNNLQINQYKRQIAQFQQTINELKEKQKEKEKNNVKVSTKKKAQNKITKQWNNMNDEWIEIDDVCDQLKSKK